MADQERNFRSQYYDKVGFRAVEEKKSIEGLLKEEHVKLEKLNHFCLHFGLPAMYRLYIWKILLGVLPVNQTCQDFVWFHRQEHVKELERASILLCPESLDSPQEFKVLLMRLIKTGNLPLHRKNLASEACHQHFLAIVRTVSGLVTSETDLFWISTRFYNHITTALGPLDQMPSQVMEYLVKEDKNQKLYQHLCKLDAISDLPLQLWFNQCFASVLPETAVERVWDRVICGSSQVLVFVAVAIFLVLRRPLLAMQSAKEIVDYLNTIPEDCGDRIVNEGLNLFQENLKNLLRKEDSPVTLSVNDSARNSTKSLTDFGSHSVEKSGTFTASGASSTSHSRHASGSSTCMSTTVMIGGVGSNTRKSPCTVKKAG